MTTTFQSLPRSTRAHESARSDIIREVLMWIAATMPPNMQASPLEWFEQHGEAYADVVTLAQLEAAIIAQASVDDALRHQGQRADGHPEINPGMLASVDGKGRPVLGQAYATALLAERHIETSGLVRVLALASAWQAARHSLARATQTMISDTARNAKSVRMLSRRAGWVRVLTPPSCSRCVVLAGKFHRNPTADFQRHPACDCTQMPVANRNNRFSENLIADPKDYFDSLTASQQDTIFTKAGAQAIRDGADVGQVVNARRGMSRAADGTPTVTNEGTTVRGWASDYLRESYESKLIRQPGKRYRRVDRPRLMPENIYTIAGGDQDLARSLLHQNGYYLDASPQLDASRSYFPRDNDLAAASRRARERLQARGAA